MKRQSRVAWITQDSNSRFSSYFLCQVMSSPSIHHTFCLPFNPVSYSMNHNASMYSVNCHTSEIALFFSARVQVLIKDPYPLTSPVLLQGSCFWALEGKNVCSLNSCKHHIAEFGSWIRLPLLLPKTQMCMVPGSISQKTFYYQCQNRHLS